MTLRTALAVVLAGAAGVVANALAAAVLIDPAFWRLAMVPQRYGLSILLTAAVPVLWRLLPGVPGFALALVFLAATPTLLVKLGLGMPVSWPVLLALNLAYALTALVVYRLAAYGLAGRL